jgi:hypothetical protein
MPVFSRSAEEAFNPGLADNTQPVAHSSAQCIHDSNLLRALFSSVLLQP